MEAPAALGAEIGLLRELRTKLNGTVHFNIQAYAFERTAWVNRGTFFLPQSINIEEKTSNSFKVHFGNRDRSGVCRLPFRCVTLLTPKTMHFPAGLRLPIGYVRLSKPVTTVYNGSCIVPRRSRGFYCIPRKSAVGHQCHPGPRPSFVVYLSGQLTSFRCSSCAPYVTSCPSAASSFGRCPVWLSGYASLTGTILGRGPLPPGLCCDR
jgi:hypothetical protein